MRLSGKVAIITGAGSGIGRASAIAYAKEGAQVAALDINSDSLAETNNIIEQAGGVVLPIVADMMDETQVAQAFQQVIEQFGCLDVMFNVAGGSGRRWGDGPVADCTLDGWNQTMNLNLTTVFLGSKYAVKQFVEQGNGSLINLASVLGMVGGDLDFATHAYAASKSGIIGLTRAIATYYAPQGIRSNAIAPGLIATNMSKRAQSSEVIKNRLQELQPLTGDFGQPEDIAHAAVYLGADESRFTTGTVLTVDGGWTAH